MQVRDDARTIGNTLLLENYLHHRPTVPFAHELQRNLRVRRLNDGSEQQAEFFNNDRWAC